MKILNHGPIPPSPIPGGKGEILVKGENVSNLSAGKDVDSYCTKCKLELGHLIVAMVGDKIAKVKCNTCGGIHNYRVLKVQKPAGTAKKAATPKIPKEIGKPPEVLWQERISKARGTEIPYEMGRVFKVGDVIAHELFGKGVVLQIASKKCTAIFVDKERIMVSAN